MTSTALIEAARDRVIPLLSEPRVFGPPLLPCACGAGRHAHAGKTQRGGCKANGCKAYRRDPVDALVLAALAAADRGMADDLRIADREHTAARGRRKHVGTVKVSASDSSSCRRSIQYRERPPADLYYSPSDKRAAFIGSLIHDGAMRVRKALYPWRLYEQTVHIEGLGDSQYDQFDPITATVDDTKTAGSWKWDLVTDSGPPPSEWRQVLIYGLALLHQGHRVETVQITYVNREKGRDQRFQRPFDKDKAEAAVAYLTNIATQIEMGVEQPRDEPGPDLSPICGRYCEFRDYCWNIPQAKDAGRSPQSWTLLGPEPADPEIEAALSEYVGALADEGAAKDRKAAAKALVGGLRPDRYGFFKFSVSPTAGSPNMKAYVERIKVWLGMDPTTRVDFDDIEIPRTPGTMTRIGRVPKSVLEKEARDQAKRDKALADSIMLTGDQ